MYDSQFKDFKGKIYTRWLGSYEVDTVFDNGIVKLVTINNSKVPLFSNEHSLWLYHKPTLKYSSVNIIIGYDLQVLEAGENSPVLSNF